MEENVAMCVQMIQKGTIGKAKREGRSVKFRDGRSTRQHVHAACSTGAMTFGDVNSEDTVAALKEEPRAFHALEDIGTKPRAVSSTGS